MSITAGVGAMIAGKYMFAGQLVRSVATVAQPFIQPIANYAFRKMNAEAQRPLQQLEYEFYQKKQALDFVYMSKMEELRHQHSIEQKTLDWSFRLQEAREAYQQQQDAVAIQANNTNVWPLTHHLAGAVTDQRQLKNLTGGLIPSLFLTRPAEGSALNTIFGSLDQMTSSFLTPYLSRGDYVDRFGAWKEGFDSSNNILAVCCQMQGEPALVLNPRMEQLTKRVTFRFASWGVAQETLVPIYDDFANFSFDEFRGIVWRDLVISYRNDPTLYGQPSQEVQSALRKLNEEQKMFGNPTDEESMNRLAVRWRDVLPDPTNQGDVFSRMSAIFGGVMGIQTALRLDLYNMIERQITPKLPLAFEEYTRRYSRILGKGALELPREIVYAYSAALRQLAYLGYGPSLFLKVARSLTKYPDTASQLLCEGVGVWACQRRVNGVRESPVNLNAAIQLVADNARGGDGAFVKDVEETLKALGHDETLVNRLPRVGGGTGWGSSRQAGERMVLGIKGVEVAFRWIPAGSFDMGGSDDEANSDEKPVHEVIITKGYWLAETPTTQRLWKAVMGGNPSSFKGDDLPVNIVSWHGCNDFIGRLNSSLRTSSSSGKLGRFRLPTEAEWEYACRAGTKGKYNVAGESLDNLGWYDGNSNGRTHAVGGKRSNAWGLCDMHGNVFECCADWYGDYPCDTVTDPTGSSSGSSRVLRGGSWHNGAGGCRSANRNGLYDLAAGFSDIGFRLLLTDEQ